LDNIESTIFRAKKKMLTLFHAQPTPRIMLFFVAVLIELAASATSAAGFVLNNSLLLIVGIGAWLCWFAILFVIAMPGADRFLSRQMGRLKHGALVIFAILLLVGLGEILVMPLVDLEPLLSDRLEEKPARLLVSLERVFAYNDATALTHQATENFIDGNNPYATANIITAIQQFNGSYDKVTPLRLGRFVEVFPYPSPEQLEQLWQDALNSPQQPPVELESRLSYPAGSFMLPAPFILMGVEDIRIVYLIFVLLALVWVTWQAPRNLRIIFIGATIISLELWNSIAGGETGSLAFPLLLLAWILPRRHLWLSALFMGLAVTTKQVAWFFIPFYFILVFRIRGSKSLLQVLGVVIGIFLATNAPFIIRDPQLWLTSLTAPMNTNMFPLGVGIVTLVTGGLLDIQSPLVFSVIEVIVAGLAVAWYLRYGHRYPHTGPILAMLPLFFAWRSLWTYFFYIGIIVLAAVVVDEYSELGRRVNKYSSSPRREIANTTTLGIDS
jgi:hypothetical protein